MPIFKKMNFYQGRFLIFPFAFAKNRCFFDFIEFPLKYGYPNGFVTLIFWNYIQFAIEWYIICLCYEKIQALRFFSQKSIDCPMGGSSHLEPCRRLDKLFFSKSFETYHVIIKSEMVSRFDIVSNDWIHCFRFFTATKQLLYYNVWALLVVKLANLTYNVCNCMKDSRKVMRN